MYYGEFENSQFVQLVRGRQNAWQRGGFGTGETRGKTKNLTLIPGACLKA